MWRKCLSCKEMHHITNSERRKHPLNAISRAIELDPLSPILLTAKGRLLH